MIIDKSGEVPVRWVVSCVTFAAHPLGFHSQGPSLNIAWRKLT